MKTPNLLLMAFFTTAMLSCGGPTAYRGDAVSSMPAEGVFVQSEKEFAANEQQQRIIKEGYFSFETKDVLATTQFVKQQVQAFGGTISSEGAYDESMRTARNMVIRVPAGNFDALVASLEQHALKVVNKNISLRDVGEEFVDVEARLNTKKQLETRYIELLGKAKTVEELLSIERELANVRGEIESMTGRLRYLTDKVALSTLNLDFFQTHSPASKFVDKLGSSFVNGWYAFLGFMVWLAGLWPFVLLALLLVATYRLRVRRHRKHN